MRLLLDAHALLWWLADDPNLGRPARDAIADPANDVLVSAGTVWKIAIKRRLGKLDAPGNLVATLNELGFEDVPITGIDGERAAGLEPHHRDPFDRILVAQAARLDAVVVTRDPVFDSYGTKTLPA